MGGLNMEAAEMEMTNPFAYSAPIWQRFSAPFRAGRFADGTAGVVSGQAGTPAARSVLKLQLQFVAGRVADGRFQAYGCPTSIAVGAWLVEWAIGKSAAELRGLSLAELRGTLEIADDRAHCAVMGEDAVLALLSQYQESRI
ncbi:MAG: aminotransferase class V-fold PLP-dependent enzyme [Nevskia sp.]|nr:aminotransferase class V-fold PLP-dependent enzyme [Nevskia sp.]